MNTLKEQAKELKEISNKIEHLKKQEPILFTLSDKEITAMANKSPKELKQMLKEAKAYSKRMNFLTDKAKAIYNSLTKEPSKLFINQIDTRKAFGISREVGDNLSKLQEVITPENAKKSYERYENGTFTKKLKNKTVALKVADDKKVLTLEQLYKKISDIKNAKVLQTFSALWNYANRQGSFVLNGVRISEIMKTVSNRTSNFSQSDKRAFTSAIYSLNDLEIFLDHPDVDINEKTGKKRKVTKRSFFRLFDITHATYAKMRKDVIYPETGEVLFNKGDEDIGVIIKLWGEILPRLNKSKMRGRLYPIEILKLDANKDERALKLGFMISTRLDQIRQGAKGLDGIPDNKLYASINRKTLIKWADYTKTDAKNKTMANQCLQKALDKLIETNCIRSYEPKAKEWTTDDDFKIILRPAFIALPKTDKMKALKDKK